MQVAINALLFFLGFSLAALVSTRPKRTRADIERFLGNVRYVLDSFKPGPRRLSQSLQSEEGKALPYLEEDDNGQVLYTRAEVEKNFPATTWQHAAYTTLTSILEPRSHPTHKTFPCIYATKGQRASEHRYVFLHSDDPSEPRNVRRLASALHTYLPASRSIGPNTSLLAICPPSPATRTFPYYNRVFWDLLRGLRIADPAPWPPEIPQATTNAKWAFCYAGHPVFPVALTPLHERRHSRWAPGLVVALQPKWVFDELFGTAQGRAAAVGKVRSLLEKYDDVDVSPDLTAYGEEGSSEVHQLFLRDDNEVRMQCPFENMEKARVADVEGPGE